MALIVTIPPIRTFGARDDIQFIGLGLGEVCSSMTSFGYVHPLFVFCAFSSSVPDIVTIPSFSHAITYVPRGPALRAVQEMKRQA
jgi:hypothetical protein